ncbi:MAG TPA: hypothetical protein VFW75_00835 [Acetobacteraceae bacterium]|nr:hypothetical protein [Acetobacteraceae bacterium]
MPIPSSDIDPYTEAYFDDPFPAHEALRDAGPLVRLDRYGVWAVARYQQVRAVLMDWQSFSSARGAGLADFKKETPWRLPSLVLETDPPLHDRTRKVLDRVLSPAAMRRLRARFAAAAEILVDELLALREFDAIPDLAEAFPLTVFPDAVGMPKENRRFLLPYGNMVFNSFGPRNAWFEAAVKDAAPVIAWVQAQSQRAALAPDGFGAAIHAAADAGELSAEEAPVVVRSVLTAGVDTTVRASVRHSIAWRGSRRNSSACAPIRGSPAPRSRRRCASKARCRPSSAPPRAPPTSAASRSVKAKRC